MHCINLQPDDEAVIKEMHASRLAAGRYKQLGMHEIARLLNENARCAERWLAAPDEKARRKITMSVSAPTTIMFALMVMGEA